MGVSTDTPATRVIGRYVLYGEIASGGMATVHFGRLLGPVGFSRTVAIKRLHPQFAKDPEFVSMFLDEARVAARIRHPNVVPTLDVVATDGELFLVMEYVQGESLGRLIRAMKADNGRPPPAIVAAIMSGVLHGLHAAHEAKNEHGSPLGIVHRDVSPQNVLVGTDGVARVLDFGVAKATGRLQTTREGQIKGKLAYMPPEQLRGADLSRSTDVYAASVVLWEALTGQRLFHGDNEGAVFAKILEAPVDPPSKLVAGLPSSFDDVTLKGLSRDVGKRFATAREMALALEACISLAPPSAVGGWVEGLAKTVLTQRNELIAEIESSSAVRLQAADPDASVPRSPSSAEFLGEMQSAQPPPSVRSARSLGPESTRSQMSSISVAKPQLPVERQGGRRKRAVVVGAVSLAVVALAFVAWRITSHASPTAVSTGGDPTAAQASQPPPSAQPLPTATLAASSAAAPPPAAGAMPQGGAGGLARPAANAMAVVPTVTSPGVPTHRNTTHGPPVGHPGANAGAGSCDPPYTLDADGNKHYKLNCL